MRSSELNKRLTKAKSIMDLPEELLSLFRLSVLLADIEYKQAEDIGLYKPHDIRDNNKHDNATSE